VELIRGKDWVEVLEVIRKLGYAEGGLAGILQAPRRGYARGGPQDWGQEAAAKEQGSANVPASNPYSDVAQRETRDLNWRNQGRVELDRVEELFAPKDTRSRTEVVPIQSFQGDSNFLDQVGLQVRNKNLYGAGLLSIEDAMKGSIKPDLYAGYSGDNVNISGQKTKDMTGVDASTMIGPVNVQGSYQDYDGDVNKNISASTQFGNFGIGTNYNFEGNPTFGASYNTDNFSGGLTYDGEPKAMFSFSKKLEPRPKYIFGKAKGGLAGILEV